MNRGIALIFVLWLTAILALAVSSMLLTLRMEVRRCALQEDSVKAFYLAKSGLAHALSLLAQDVNGFDSYSEEWAFIDSAQSGLPEEQGRYIVKVEDESGKLNLNMASRDELIRFFGDEEIADAIIDWRDRDDAQSAYGAEADWYTLAGLPYKPRNGPFETLHELLLVRGVSKDTFYSVMRDEGQVSTPAWNHLTVYSSVPNVMPDGSPLVNLNRASEEELKSALGDVLTDDEVRAIVRYRSGSQAPQQLQRPQEGANQKPLPSEAINQGMNFGNSQAGATSSRAVIAQPPTPSPEGMATHGEQQQPQRGSEAQARSFNSLSDLFSVPGLPHDKARRIIDRVTIWDGNERYGVININTAPFEVLMSIPTMSESIANDIIAFRQTNGAFESLAQLLDLPSVDEEAFRRLVDHVSIRTNTFRIISVGWMSSGARHVIECIIERLPHNPVEATSQKLQTESLSTGFGQPVAHSGSSQKDTYTFLVRYWRER